MIQDKLVSVIIPTFKSAKYLYESIYSIVNQSYRNLEIIIVDDTPTDDGTKGILDSFNDERIVYVKPETRLGMVKSLNYAISLSHGEYIARMDADDISHKGRLTRQVEYLNAHEEVGVVGCAYYTINEKDKITGCYTHPEFDNEIKAKMLFNTAMAHPTVMMRKSVLDICKYNEDCYCCEDYELWSRMMSITQFHNLQEKLFKYRILKNSAMQSQLTRLKTDEEYYKKHTAILKMIYDNILAYYGVDGNELATNYVDMLLAKKIDDVSPYTKQNFLKKCQDLLRNKVNNKILRDIISYQWLKMSNKKFWISKNKKLILESGKEAMILFLKNYFSIIQGVLIKNKETYNWKI